MRSVAILYIAIGKYSCFWKGFYISIERFFLPMTAKEYYIFTDQKNLYAQEMENVHLIYQKDLGWPKNTFYRFSFFNSIYNELIQYDYVFFMNANIYCNMTITEKEFLPEKENLVCVLHHAFVGVDNNEYPYERNKESMAYIPSGEGEFYITGGINGGKAKAFLELSKQLEEWIKIDEQKKIIAIWHDESFINRYILGRKDCKILSASYFYPELLGGMDINCERKMVARDKRKYFNVAKLKREEITMETDKYLESSYYFRLCFKWLLIKSKSISTLDEIKIYNNIAIYSFNKLGELLISEIEENNMEKKIACILAPEPDKYKGNYPVCKPYEFGKEIDLIIVTETYHYADIVVDISMFSDVKIFSLEDIINQLIIKNHIIIDTKLW